MASLLGASTLVTGLGQHRAAFAFKAGQHVNARGLRLQVLSVGPGPGQQRQGGGGGGGGRPNGGAPFRIGQNAGVRTAPRPGGPRPGGPRPGGGPPGGPRPGGPQFGGGPRPGGPRPDRSRDSYDDDDFGGRRGGRRFGNRERQQQTLVPINDAIRAPEVRVLSEAKEQLGVMPTAAAMDMARDLEVDLVLLVPDASPPVCRLISYSKYKYELEKADKDKKKAQRESRIDTKELKLRPNTDTHDYDTKLRQAQKHLSKGDRVKVTLQFKGREMDHNEIGKQMFTRLLADLEGEAVVEQSPSFQGRSMNMVLAPKKAVLP